MSADTDGASDTTEAEPPIERWRALATRALKGEAMDTLTRLTEGGVARGPLFTAADRPERSARMTRRPAPDGRTFAWDVRGFVDGRSPDEVNRIALAELEGGATSLSVVLDPSGDQGLSAFTANDLAHALKGVWLNAAPISLAHRPNPSGEPQAMLTAAHALLDVWRDSDAPSGDIAGALNVDPIGLALGAPDTADPDPITNAIKAGFDLLERVVREHPKATVFFADGSMAHEMGGDDVQELAWMAACAAAYLRAGAQSDVMVDSLAPRIHVALAATPDVHVTIAKLRAARMIFARIVAGFGGSPAGHNPSIEARTSYRMLQSQDAWTNQIRTSCAVLGAGIGGADAIVTLPFTQTLGKATDQARRIARNQQLMALQEAHLGAVDDPAAGSYAHEALTDRLARAAWVTFQAIEASGGAIAYLFSGQLARDLDAAKNARHARLDAGEEVIVGVTQYAADDIPTPETAP